MKDTTKILQMIQATGLERGHAAPIEFYAMLEEDNTQYWIELDNGRYYHAVKEEALKVALQTKYGAFLELMKPQLAFEIDWEETIKELKEEGMGYFLATDGLDNRIDDWYLFRIR